MAGLLAYGPWLTGETATWLPGHSPFHIDIAMAALLGGFALLTRDRLPILSRLLATMLAALCLAALLIALQSP
ncbi:hypothetical protein, partial [Ferrovibrio sp.]|uniref:hypothetical protein n=1 Tax=Ferrovibrio sp. TaxID=1917215 RepID=UPI00260C8D79